MKALSILLADPSHLEALLPLVRGYHAFEGIDMGDAERARALGPLLAPDNPLGRVWLVRHQSEWLGYAAVCFGYSIEFGGRDAFLDELFLVETARARGLGAKVLEAVATWLADVGILALHLEVARHNARARRFYRELGFDDRDGFQLMSRRLTGHGKPPDKAG